MVFIRISSIVNIESSCLSESHEWRAFRYPRFFGRRVRRKSWKQKTRKEKLFKAKVVSLKQKGGGKEFELRTQTPTKQPSTQISQLCFISFGFYLSSFAFYEAGQYKTRTTDYGLRTTDYGLRTMDYGLRTTDYGLRTTDYGLRTTDYGLRTTDYGLRTTDYGLHIKHGLRYKTQTKHYGLCIKHEHVLGCEQAHWV